MANKNKIIGTFKDTKGRPLLILMRTKRDTIIYIFKRYVDMGAKEKDMLISLHNTLASKLGVMEGIEGDISNFLNFKSDRPCG